MPFSSSLLRLCQRYFPLQFQDWHTFTLGSEDHAVVVAVPRHLPVHYEAPLEGEPVDASATLGLHHMAPESVQIDMTRVDTFPDLPVRSSLLAPLPSPGSEHFALVGGELDIVHPPGASQVQFLEMFSLAKLCNLLFQWVRWWVRRVGRVSRHICWSVWPNHLDTSQNLLLIVHAEPKPETPDELVWTSLAGKRPNLPVSRLGTWAEPLCPNVVLYTEAAQVWVVFGEWVDRISSPEVILLWDAWAPDEGVQGGVILKVGKVRQSNAAEVKVVSYEWQLESSEQGPGVSDPHVIVLELHVLDDDAHQSLLPLYGRQHSAKLAVKDDAIALDALGEELNWKLLEILAAFQKLLEVISDEVDRLLKQPLYAQCVGKPQHRDNIGQVEVPGHEVDTLCAQVLDLKIVWSLQEILDVLCADVSLAGVEGPHHGSQGGSGQVHLDLFFLLVAEHSLNISDKEHYSDDQFIATTTLKYSLWAARMILCARTSPWSLLKVKWFLTLDKFYNHEPAKDNIIEEAVLIIVDLPQIVHQLKILQDDEKFHYVEKLMKSFFSITCKECSWVTRGSCGAVSSPCLPLLKRKSNQQQ